MSLGLTIILWIARIWALAAVAVLVVFIVGNGGLPPFSLKMMLFPIGVAVGLLLAWRFELVGGALAAVCILLFYGLEYAENGRFPKGWAFFMLSGASVLFVLCSFARLRSRS